VLHGREEADKNVLVEDGDTAERTAVPFSYIFLELGVQGLQEWSHERLLEGRPNNGTLLEQVADYK